MMRLSFVGLGFLFACSSSAPVDSADDDFTVHPTAGSTQIEVVALANAKTESVVVRRSGASDQSLTLSTPTGLSAGTVDLLVGTGGGRISTTRTSLPLAEGALTTVKLGGLRLGRTTTDLIAGFDIAGVVYGSDPVSSALRAGLGSILSVAPDADATIPMGTHRIKARAAEGAITDVAIDNLDGLQAVRIVPPATREFPDVAPVAVSTSEFWETTLNGLGSKPILFIGPQTQIVGEAGATVRFVTGNRSNGFILAMPYVDATHPITTVQLQRLDVAAVDVTLPDGTKKTVQGLFGARRQSDGFSFSGETDHGADVPPGIYDVNVDFQHPTDGRAMRYQTTVDLH